jgi:hypothetical protein
MKQKVTLTDLEKYEQVTLQHIVYEADDSELLLSCKITNQGKTYFTHFTMDFSGLNQLIAFYTKKGFDIYDALTERLLANNERFREFDFQRYLGENATLITSQIAA